MLMKAISRLVLAIAGTGLALAGFVFLVQASWGAIAIAFGPLWASALIGATLGSAGLLLFAKTRRPKPATPSPQAALVGAFLEGMKAGRATASRDAR